MNKIYLIGNTTKDAEKSETQSGVAVCRFSIAVNRDYANADGTKITDFFNITTWRGLAETCGKFLSKGSKVAIVGSLQNRSYEDKDGIKRTVTEIVASEVEFLSTKKEDKEEKPTQIEMQEVDDDSDLPF
jgi:single-strand DNA-binding protein